MSQVLDAITQSGKLLDNANVGTRETLMEAGGVGLVGGTVVPGAVLDSKAKKKLSTASLSKVYPQDATATLGAAMHVLHA